MQKAGRSVLIAIASIAAAMLAGCGQETEPAAKAACTEVSLAQKIASYGQKSAELADRATRASSPEAVESYDAFSRSLQAKTKEIEAAAAQGEDKRMETLCAGYDALIGLVVDAIKAMPPAEPKAEAPAAQ